MTTPTPTASFTDQALLAQLHQIRLSPTDKTVKQQIPDQLVSTLLALSRQTNQPVKATVTKEPAKPRTGALGDEILMAKHTIEFRLNQGKRTVERYIRFVRAAKIVTAGIFPAYLRLSHTRGGYVSYVDVAQESRPREPLDRTELIRKINKLFETAAWCFDGPRDEFRGGELSAVDQPGVRTFGSDVYPVLQRFDFIGVLYNPPDSGAAAGILNVTYYQDSFIALRKDGPVERLKPLPV